MSYKTSLMSAISPVKAITGVSYVLSKSDNFHHLTVDNASDVTISIPTQSVGKFSDPTTFYIQKLGDGKLTIAPPVADEGDPAVVMHILAGKIPEMTAKAGIVTIKRLASNVCTIIGNLDDDA